MARTDKVWVDELGIYLTIPTAELGVATIDPDTGELINPATLVRRQVVQQNVSNSQAGIVLPAGVQRVTIRYEQRVGGTTATGVALRYIVGAISSGQATQMLASTIARNTLVMGGEISVAIDASAAAGPIRLDYQTTTAETGHSTLTIEYLVPPLAINGSYFARCPCAQLAGDTLLETLVGSMTGALNSNLQGASPWAAGGYLSVPATSGDYSVSWSAANWIAFWSWARGDILLILMTVNFATTPGASTGFFGNVGASGDGFRLRVTPTGLDAGINTGGVAAPTPIWTDAAVFDAADHYLGVVIDANAKKMAAVIDDILVMSMMDFSNSAPGTPTNPTKLGRSISGSTVVPVAKYKNLHIFKPDNSLSTSDLMRIVSRYALDTGVSLLEGVV